MFCAAAEEEDWNACIKMASHFRPTPASLPHFSRLAATLPFRVLHHMIMKGLPSECVSTAPSAAPIALGIAEQQRDVLRLLLFGCRMASGAPHLARIRGPTCSGVRKAIVAFVGSISILRHAQSVHAACQRHLPAPQAGHSLGGGEQPHTNQSQPRARRARAGPGAATASDGGGNNSDGDDGAGASERRKKRARTGSEGR